MIAGFWTFSLKPGAFDSFREFFNRNVHDMVTGATGFKRLASYYDPNSNQVITVLEWESEEDAANVRANPDFQPVMNTLGGFLIAPPTRAVYQMTQEAWTPLGVRAG